MSEPRAVATGSAIAQPSEPKVDLPTEQLARNNPIELPTSSRDDGKSLSDSPPTLRASAPPQSGPPTFDDDPLQVGQTPIKSIHITQLRTAINDLRARRGYGPYVWNTAAQPGDLIKADPILEMRIALDGALGPPPSPGYARGLAYGQPILAVHIQELRDRVKNNWNSSASIPRDGLGSLSYGTTTRGVRLEILT